LTSSSPKIQSKQSMALKLLIVFQALLMICFSILSSTELL